MSSLRVQQRQLRHEREQIPVGRVRQQRPRVSLLKDGRALLRGLPPRLFSRPQSRGGLVFTLLSSNQTLLGPQLSLLFIFRFKKCIVLLPIIIYLIRNLNKILLLDNRCRTVQKRKVSVG